MTLGELQRKDFPILESDVCFLDSGASSQKPQAVLDTQKYFSEKVYANVHRGTYSFSQEITDAYEKSRVKIANFIGGKSDEVVFTKNATESINLVANSFGSLLSDGDEIIISAMEHHANIVPWQLLQTRKNISLKVCPILDDGSLDMVAFGEILTDKTALVAITQTSNVLGSVVDVKTIATKAHAVGAKILVDGSQSIVHQSVDVVDLGVDFFVFTGHKLYAPTGIGVLWGRKELLDTMPPFLGGGDMIESVSFEKTTFAPVPAKFEAGTPPIVQAICLGIAVDYVAEIGIEKIEVHEQELYRYAVEKITKINGVKIIGTAENKAPILSFVVEGIHAFDIAEIISNSNVCIRVGNHCAEPLMKRFGITGTLRVSFAMYNIKSDVDKFITSLEKAVKMLG